MKQIFAKMVNKYFGVLCGIIFLATLLIIGEIMHNIGNELLTQKSIRHGWIVVAVWSAFILVLSIFTNEKKSENQD